MKGKTSSSSSPLSFLTWNVNGLISRIKQRDNWLAFLRLVNHWQPDIICFQEVKLPAYSPIGAKRNDGQHRIHGKIKDNEKANSEEINLISSFLLKELNQYYPYWSLSEWRYSGQLLLTKINLSAEQVRFNIDLDSPPEKHNPEGRVIIVFFPKFIFVTTYSPNHGSDEPHFDRRRKWDIQLLKFFEYIKSEGRSIIWTGDLNCAPTDNDLSHPQFFRLVQPNLRNPFEFLKLNNIKDYCGYPGCTNIERIHFSEILQKGDLVDVFREFYPVNTSPPTSSAHYTWRGHPGRENPNLGKFYSRAMRLDHFITSSTLLKGVEKILILGYEDSRVNFFGSDHCPVYLQLNKNFQTHNICDENNPIEID